MDLVHASRPSPYSRIASWAFWICLGVGVLFSGIATGVFVVEWVRTPDNGLPIYRIGEKWLNRFLSIVPMGAKWQDGWHSSFLHFLTAHFPGMLFGGSAALFFWLFFSMKAAWQNCLLFPLACRRIGSRILPLLSYFVLARLEYNDEFLIRQWIAFLPLAAVIFWVAAEMRRIRERALPAERNHPQPADVNDRIPLALLALFSLLRFWEWYCIGWMRHNHFYSQAYDLGLMTHVMNRLVTGEGMTSSLLVAGGSFLGHHFSPILLLLAPFSFFCPHPETLLFAQAAMVAFASIPLYFFAKNYLRSNWTAFAISMIYLFLPGLSNGVYSGFHAIAFAPFLLFWVAAEALRGPGRRFWIALILLLSVQENLFLYSFSLGLFFLCHKKYRGIGLRLSGISVIAGFIVFFVFQPMFRPESGSAYGFVHRYKDFLPDTGPTEGGIGDLVGGILSHPGTVISVLFDESRLRVYKLFWRGPLYLPLVNPAGWLLLLPILENSLSSEPVIYEWNLHYGIGPASLTALALVAGFGFLGRWERLRRIEVPLAFALLVSSIFWALKKAYLPYSIYVMSVYYAIPSEPAETYRILMEEIPPNSSVAAQSYLVPHLTHQREIYELPPARPKSTAPIADPTLPNFDRLEPDVGWPQFLVFRSDAPEGQKWHNLWFYDRTRTLEWIDWLLRNGKYRVFYPHGLEGEPPSPITILKRVEPVE